MLSDEAVEAAARVVYATCEDEPELPENYDGEPDAVKDYYRSLAQPILEAAAPDMLAQAWDQGESAGQGNYGRVVRRKTNPYRSQA